MCMLFPKLFNYINKFNDLKKKLFFVFLSD